MVIDEYKIDVISKILIIGQWHDLSQHLLHHLGVCKGMHYCCPSGPLNPKLWILQLLSLYLLPERNVAAVCMPTPMPSHQWMSECSCPSLHKHSPACLERKVKIAKSFFNSTKLQFKAHDGINWDQIITLHGNQIPLSMWGGGKVLITSFQW